MKRILVSAAASLILSLPSLKALEPYFCTNQGTKLNYVRTNVEDASVRWNHVMTIESTLRSGDKTEIGYSSRFSKANGKSMYGGPVKLHAEIGVDGSVKMDVAQSVASVFSNLAGSRIIKSTGGETVLPADMKPNDRLPDAVGTASAGPVHLTVEVTERQVLRSETVVTPAGTFDCMVVREHKVEKGLRNRITTALTWYARGVGMVRHDTYDKDMVLETSEILVSIGR